MSWITTWRWCSKLYWVHRSLGEYWPRQALQPFVFWGVHWQFGQVWQSSRALSFLRASATGLVAGVGSGRTSPFSWSSRSLALTACRPWSSRSLTASLAWSSRSLALTPSWANRPSPSSRWRLLARAASWRCFLCFASWRSCWRYNSRSLAPSLGIFWSHPVGWGFWRNCALAAGAGTWAQQVLWAQPWAWCGLTVNLNQRAPKALTLVTQVWGGRFKKRLTVTMVRLQE